jgi:transposase InsO family protein
MSRELRGSKTVHIGATRRVKPVERVHRQAFTRGAKSCLWAYALVQFEPMNWKRMLAYVTGSVDEELLARNEYLVTENRILRNQIRGRIRLTDPERISLASAAKRLGRKGLQEVAQIVRPETILGWHRRLIAKKFDGTKNRSPGKGGGATSDKIEELVLQLARENRSWGYRRIVGALSNLGHEVSHQTVANVLKRHDIAPAPERQRTMSWREFIRSHMEVLAAVDFFTVEVWTAGGLITFYVLSCMRVASREVCIAGITTWPDQRWMEQMARNISFADTGILNGCRYLLHDRDAKFCSAFTGILEAVGIKAVKLPARSPNLNANLERWHRSLKEECLSKMILFGEASLRRVLSNYVLHFHGERNHQGKGNVILFPRPEDRVGESTGEIQTRERLGGLLKFYFRKAA